MRLNPAMAAVLLAAAAMTPSQAAEFKILALGSLTGPAAFVGVPVANGIRLAVEEINNTNFLGEGNTLSVEFQDDATDRNQALSVINTKIRSDDGILAILGPTTTDVALTTGGLVNEIGIVSFASTSGVGILGSGPYSFIGVEPAVINLPLLVDFAAKKFGMKKCAIISADNNDVHVRNAAVFVEQFEAHGAEVVDHIKVKLADSDFSAAATRVVSRDPDCVAVASHAVASANMVLQLRQAGLPKDVPIFGTVAAASSDFAKTLGKQEGDNVYFIGEWVPGGSDDETRSYSERYQAAYGNTLDNWSPMGYTFTYVLATAIRNAGENPTRESIRDALARTTDVPVIIGSKTFSIDGERLPRYGSLVLTLKEGEFAPAE